MQPISWSSSSSERVKPRQHHLLDQRWAAKVSNRWTFARYDDLLACATRSRSPLTLQEFNARTAHYVPGTPIPARIIVRPDRSFTFSLKTPTTSMLLLSAAGILPVKNKFKGAGNTAGARSLASIISSATRSLNGAQHHPRTDPYREEGKSTSGHGPKADEAGQFIEAAKTHNAIADVSDSQGSTAPSILGVEQALAAKGKESNSKDARVGNALLGTVGRPVSLKHVYEIAKIKQVDIPGASLRAVAGAVVAQAGSMGVVIVP